MKESSQLGIRQCMKCGWRFVSPDVERIRRCQDCKQGDNEYTPRSARDPQAAGAQQAATLKDLR